jgi:3-dehydroquinate dehydratase
VIAEVCDATIYGRGVDGYRDAIRHLTDRAIS